MPDSHSPLSPQGPVEVSQARPRAGRGVAPWSKTFEALAIPGYRWYWLGTAAAFLGMQMQWPAQSWLAYQLTGSAFMLGLVSAAWGAPMFILSLFGGALADRMEKRTLLLMSQLALGLVNLALALLISFDLVRFWHLLVAAVLSGTVFAFNMPARQAIVPQLVPRKALFNAITLSSGAMNATRVMGPAMAGVLMAVMGVDGALYAAVGCTLLAFAFLTKLPTTGVGHRAGRTSVSREITEGLRYIWRRPLVLTLLSMVMVMVLFGMPYQNLLPVFAEILDVKELGFGFLMAMTGVGAVIGSLALAGLGDFRRKGALLLSCGIAFGLTLVAFAYAGSLALALPVLMFVGAASTSFMSLNNTLIQMNISDDVRGRVMSVYMMTFGMMPLGVLPAGAIAERMGAPVAVTLGGGVLAAFLLLLAILQPRLRKLE